MQEGEPGKPFAFLPNKKNFKIHSRVKVDLAQMPKYSVYTSSSIMHEKW